MKENIDLQIQKEYIIFYHVWFLVCILEQVFQMAHKKIFPPCPPFLPFFDIQLVVYNLMKNMPFISKLSY